MRPGGRVDAARGASVDGAVTQNEKGCGERK